MANVYDPKAIITLPGRSKFDLSYRNSFTTKMGLEVPVLMEQVIPGDRFRVGLTYQMQLAPMLNPVYDGLEVNFESFFVPNRILDPKWKEFWTGYNEYDQMTPVEVAPLMLRNLQVELADVEPSGVDKAIAPPIGIGSLLDFLGYQFSAYDAAGIPDFYLAEDAGYTFNDLNINLLPILAYNRIYDDWYRNERTQKARLYDYYNESQLPRYYDMSYTYEDSEYTIYEGKIPLTLFSRNYKKDRFTTSLPEPVIGGDVHIPVNQNLDAALASGPDDAVVRGVDGAFNLNALALGTIEQLKLAFKEYQYRMKDTYNGNRYVESIESHFGVRVPDSTLQRSLYLGSARDYVNFGEVYQTSSGDGQAENGALGDYAGRGAASGSNFMFDETFYEPGFVFVLMCVNPISRYFQGAKRLFTRFDRDDYFSPEYQNIGDDFIRNDELYHQYKPIDSFAFGYQSRWVEYKTRYNELHGEFANPNSQMFTWNFARSFDALPTISSEFSAITPINKPFVDTDIRNDNYFVDIAFDFQALRPILAVESF